MQRTALLLLALTGTTGAAGRVGPGQFWLHRDQGLRVHGPVLFVHLHPVALDQ